MKACAVIALALVPAAAFLAPVAVRPMHMMRSASALQASAEDIQALATSCLEEGCSVEMVDDLVASLKVRRSALILQLANVDDLLRQLEGSHAEKQSGAVNDIIKSVARLFSKGDDDYPMLSAPTGYSGDSHKGTKDAWDYKMDRK
ncbi:hypothetical protein JKP88DRAFT_233986 [Tribonema minus]|uniref:Uncharacterized protein n=1 Tax=Tribonema minus TaxID=303371 RepID=A0A836CJD3_9STRA|nr:hypothetical protein JKP88DRAFT_233986 [Tribonema minus]